MRYRFFLRPTLLPQLLRPVYDLSLTSEVVPNFVDRFVDELFTTTQHWTTHQILIRGGLPDIPVDLMLGNYIIKGGGTILFAPPGRGKSWIGLLMACSVDSGVSDVWDVPTARKCLFVNLERSAESVQRRLGLVNTAMG